MLRNTDNDRNFQHQCILSQMHNTKLSTITCLAFDTFQHSILYSHHRTDNFCFDKSILGLTLPGTQNNCVDKKIAGYALGHSAFLEAFSFEEADALAIK
jgi:hypothetical protein